MYLIKDTNVGMCSTIISTTMSNIVITSIKDHGRKKISSMHCSTTGSYFEWKTRLFFLHDTDAIIKY